jgi:hypothetical protein
MNNEIMGSVMTERQALERAFESAIMYHAYYIVAVEPREGGYVYGALKAINLVHPSIRASNYVYLVTPSGKVEKL